jgi:UDP-N-acetylglucosamine 1-carboxyvinyltransferase
MSSIIVTGGRPLTGSVRVAGAKNSALKLMAAALLAPGESVIRNVPEISDVQVMAEVLEHLGARVGRDGDVLSIDAGDITSVETPYELVAQMRASIVVLGPLVARFGRARVAMPGGCNIGSRKIDMHVHGLEQLGAHIEFEHGYIEASAPDGLAGAHVILDFPSVGATENLLMAAVLASGVTTIENAAREPEIGDLVDMLVTMGASIAGRGSSTLEVTGVDALAPAEHATVGDRIEAGTFLAAAAITGGEVTVSGFDPAHLEMVITKMRHAGCTFELGPDRATVRREGALRPVDVATLPFPGFPTDMQAQFMAMMAIADGTCLITENVFENRFMFADELKRMGADIDIEGHRALVRGVSRLEGAPVRSPDLRGGAALVLAGLAAEGETRVTDVHHIVRGYEDFAGKLAALGAGVRMEDD